MSISKVVIYGNLIKDTIYEVDGSFEIGGSHEIIRRFERDGGAWNVCRAITSLSKSINVHAYGRPGNATVICDVVNATKTSFVDWGDTKRPEGLSFADDVVWQHIAYIDKMPFLTKHDMLEMRKFGPISADLCMTSYSASERNHVLELLQFVDFIIASDTEMKPLGIWNHNVARKATIGHHSCGSKLITPIFAGSLTITKQDNINVLGAGDWFAGAFIVSQLRGHDIRDSIVYAHKETEKMINGQYTSADCG